jgi:hypothetical protein
VTSGNLVTASTERRTKLSLGTKGDASCFLRQAEKLRNVLAHSQHDLVDGSSWEQTIEMVEWIENGVQTSDLQVEQLASSYAVRYEDRLWASA